MENNRILSGGINELNILKVRIQELDDSRGVVERLKQEKAKSDKEITSKERGMSDAIDRTIKRKREELSQIYDNEIATHQTELKTVRSSREKAKAQGIKSRITSETEEYHKDVEHLHEEIRTSFRQKGIPVFCDSRFFYAMYFPHGSGDVVIQVLFWLVAVIALPLLVVWLVSPSHIFFRVLLYLVIALIPAMIVYFVRIHLKTNHQNTFTAMLPNRNKIRENQDRIHSKKKEIRQDHDESHYNLDEYDQNIAHLEEEIKQVVANKNQALADFELHAKPEIIQEITQRDQGDIDQQKEKSVQLDQQITAESARSNELSTALNEEYADAIGADFLSVQKIQDLIVIMEEGKLQTIAEAKNLYLQNK